MQKQILIRFIWNQRYKGRTQAGHGTAGAVRCAVWDEDLLISSHHPEYYPLIPAEVDLILSGHAHGGQWRMYNPFKREWIGTFAPGQGWWPRYTKGVYDGRMVVSAGLSNTTWVPRIRNPTEVVYLESP